MDEKEILVKNWLIKSKHDITAAKKLNDDEGECLDIAIYHCQQAAEQAVKSFLTYHSVDFPKTHDIRLLVLLAININSEMNKYIETAELLTPYATEFRYPSEILDPSKEELDVAIIKAEELFNFVITLLPSKIKRILNNKSQ